MNLDVSIYVVGLMVGIYTFIRHLRVFSKTKTPSADAWLVAVGMMGWSVLLYASLDEPTITSTQRLAHMLCLVYWVGSLLQIQKHCLRIRRKLNKGR